jgi:plastocyanin
VAGAQSAPASESVPEAPQSVAASNGSVLIDAGNEWFGDPSFQGGVYEITVHAGDTVQWNVTEGIHNVYECGDNWSNVSSSCDGSAWSSDQVLTSGSTFAYTFDTAGTFYYLCTIHPQTMRGKIMVEAQDEGQTTTPTPTPAADDSADTGSAVGGAADDAASNPGSVVAGEAALPNGGGAPPVGGGMPTTPFFVAAAVAFAASGLIFWRWKQVSAER